MTRSRDEHLAWCKSRALEILAKGDLGGAVASMISDLGKRERPLYEPDVFRLLLLDGMTTRRTPVEVQSWIEGFA